MGRKLPGLVAVVATFALLFAGGALWFRSANADMLALHDARLADLAVLRPVVQRYRAERGHYPARLEDLVPDYVPRLPDSLTNGPDVESVKRLSYHADQGSAGVSFHRHRGPDSRVDYDFANGAVSVDE